jgi:hypothetical protein
VSNEGSLHDLATGLPFKRYARAMQMTELDASNWQFSIASRMTGSGTRCPEMTNVESLASIIYGHFFKDYPQQIRKFLDHEVAPILHIVIITLQTLRHCALLSDG